MKSTKTSEYFSPCASTTSLWKTSEVLLEWSPESNSLVCRSLNVLVNCGCSVNTTSWGIWINCWKCDSNFNQKFNNIETLLLENVELKKCLNILWFFSSGKLRTRGKGREGRRTEDEDGINSSRRNLYLNKSRGWDSRTGLTDRLTSGWCKGTRISN